VFANKTAEKGGGGGRKSREVHDESARIAKIGKGCRDENLNYFGAQQNAKTDQRRITLLNGRIAWVNGTEQS
jgi:hypothetical protein